MSRILRVPLLAVLIALASAVPASAQSPGGLVINEIDYDQPSTDTAEYLEIRNNGAASVNLDLFTLRFVNGSGGADYLPPVDLPAVDLAPGGYFVVCGNPTAVSECDLDAGAATDLIQNGAPDAVALQTGGATVDAVSYEGAVPGFSEGAAGAPADSNTTPGSLSRVPDGCDTDDNAADLTVVAATPGASNGAGTCGGGPPIEDLRIHDIQGASHVSPYQGAIVAGVPGVVTAVRRNGYFIQDPKPDRDLRTSEGIFVFTGSAPAAALVPGTPVSVSGRVGEFRAGGVDSTNLSTTQITGATATPVGTGTIAPTLVGRGGRVPPGEVVEDDTVDPGGEDPPTTGGDVEQGDPLFDPGEDGLDFYESLEGMLTEVRNAVAVAPTVEFGSGAGLNRELAVLADNGAGASVRASRGPIVVRGFDSTAPQEFRRGDFNPERITLNDANHPTGAFLPLADVRDRFTAPVRAVVDYSFGNYKFLALNNPPLADGRLQPEQTRKRDRDELAVASYNVENLDGADLQARYDRVAQQIVGNLRSPDILSLEEIQDNDGAAPTPSSSADLTHKRLIETIERVGGPRYDYRQIDPAPGDDGGEPGGNIRVSFLFRTDVRDLRFVDRPGGDATTPTKAAPGPGGAQLTFSPGRVDPTNTVWASSRKPLAGEFRYRGRQLFVVGNHFNSKGGDDPTFGRFQEPRRTSELQRRGSATDPADTTRGQAGVVNRFVRDILDIDRRARVIVLGDLNDFDFSETLRVVEQGPSTNSSPELVNLWRLLPRSERYSYIFQGNAQTLDHILVSPALLLAGRPDLDVVHMNTEFAGQASDHDPSITRLELDD